MPKKLKTVTAKTGQLRTAWGRPDKGEEPSLCYAWGGQGANASDARLMMRIFEDTELPNYGHSFAKELEARGYDLSTFKFSIERKTENAE